MNMHNQTTNRRLRAATRVAIAAAVLLAAMLVPEHASAGSNSVKNPGFESGLEKWKEKSQADAPIICTTNGCGDSNGKAVPRTGTRWAWIGGLPFFEKGQVSQNVTFPSGGSATLSFYLYIGRWGDAPGKFKVTIDGESVFKTNYDNPKYEDDYVLVSKDVSQFADGQRHKIVFSGTQDGSGTPGNEIVTNFNVDDVMIAP